MKIKLKKNQIDLVNLKMNLKFIHKHLEDMSEVIDSNNEQVSRDLKHW